VKKIEAIIKPFKLDEVKEQLSMVTPVGEVIRIRTGERGDHAL
jgi:nitrogen regulatory protein PII